MLAQRGARICDADVVVEELYRAGRPGAAAVRELFGSDALAGDGSVDREGLARLVLADAAARRRLEEAVHPLVRKSVEGWFAALAHATELPGVAVVEAALLVETGAYRSQDRLVVVSAAYQIRRERALAAGWTAERFSQVADAQLDDPAREAVADYVVRNEDGVDALEREAEALWTMLQEDARLLAAGKALPPRHTGS
jgi:dephospho-CoA kinase